MGECKYEKPGLSGRRVANQIEEPGGEASSAKKMTQGQNDAKSLG
jgi:hypothetical protein